MRHNPAHAHGPQNPLARPILGPLALNIELAAGQKRFPYPDELNGQVLFVAGERIGFLQIQFPGCPENQVLKAEFARGLFKINLAYLGKIRMAGQGRGSIS